MIFRKHDCIELLECKHFPTNSINEYEDCINRKAAVLVDSAVGTGMTLGDFFAAMNALNEVAEKAKELVTSQIIL